MTRRRKSKPLQIGAVTVGGDAPIVVQSMANTKTADVQATLRQIQALAELGCEIARLAVPDRTAADALPEIVAHSPLPVVADIHFDHRLALAALAAGVHGLRLNPGNIRDADKVREVVREAKARQTPIRIGVNAGSLPPLPLLAEGEPPPPTWQRMVDAALWEIGILEDMGFDLIKVSLKAFDVPTMLQAYRTLAKRVPYPLHLGVTESGTPRSGSVRSAIGIGVLLSEGIGDTIRVSLSADPT
ncbi:MAG: flavodoxin/ferredoxin-dependent (E)-4-hydroxy-3-methylbut-2-enyl-diphosphate synthase, partial [Dehalococcoidia bacterium]